MHCQAQLLVLVRVLTSFASLTFLYAPLLHRDERSVRATLLAPAAVPHTLHPHQQPAPGAKRHGSARWT